jgi:hypothetical protein
MVLSSAEYRSNPASCWLFLVGMVAWFDSFLTFIFKNILAPFDGFKWGFNNIINFYNIIAYSGILILHLNKMKKLTKIEINKKIQSLFKGEVSIQWKNNYIGRKQKVLAKHKIFGEWEVTIDKLLSGKSHPLSNKVKFLSKEEIDTKIKGIHNNNVHIDWSKTKFPLILKDYVIALDKDFGPWRVRLQSLLDGNGHKKRYYDNKKLKKEDVDSKIAKIFKGKVYINWENRNYLNNKQKVEAVDIEFGKWNTPIYKLLLGVKNKKRSSFEQSQSKRLSKEEINKLVLEIHKGIIIIDWNNSPPYENNDSYVIAVDETHGPWPIKIKNLLRGQGHKSRFIEKVKLKKEYIDSKISVLFKNKVNINWEKTGDYLNNQSKVFANHIDAGEWETSVGQLLQGHNHPSLGSSSSKGEEEMLSWLKSLNIQVSSRKVFKINNKNYEVDIYIEDYKIGIEYNGIYYHSEVFKKPKDHFLKREALESININLFQFLENEWSEQKEIVKSMILSKINHPSIVKYNARDLKVIKLNKQESQLFLKENHLMGEYKPASYYALISKDNIIVSLIGVQNKGKTLEISRFCNKKLSSVRGGFSKLLSFLIKTYNPSSVLSFVDLRSGTGNSLIANGFNLESITLGWNWTNFKQVYNRRFCRANMDSRNLSEREYADEMGLVKIYDAGQAKFIKKIN